MRAGNETVIRILKRQLEKQGDQMFIEAALKKSNVNRCCGKIP